MAELKNPITILYENHDIIIADKDRETAVHGGEDIEESSTLLYKVREYLILKYGLIPDFIAPMHRIDMNTRGPVLFAKSWTAAKEINLAFSSGLVHKTYMALLDGKLENAVFVQADIIKSSHKRALVRNIQMLKDNFPAREDWLREKNQTSTTISATIIKPIETYEDTTLCDVDIWSGRYHQIRAVSESIGFPVCGDHKYNHNPRHHNHRVTNKNYPSGQMLLCKSLEIPILNISVQSLFKLEVV